ncbi:RxLR effector protein [Phytophthora megakarya]|uniref:RxLR effector protein n=1 Tax=Phytophthora megakarya TaxID=4795 RepID=A0A225V467_9STRA|nr:RxLR effector protein [Phytophthora megakarya]
MRVLSFVAFATVVSVVFSATSSEKTDIAKAEHNVELLTRKLPATLENKQSLRTLHQYELAKPNEERVVTQVGEMADDIVTKTDTLLRKRKKADDILERMDDVYGKAKIPKNLNAAVKRATTAMDDVAALEKRLEHYPQGLSDATMQQLLKEETLRLKDVATYSKESGTSMRRKIEPFEGIKIAPEKYLASKHGCEVQRYSKDGKRLLSSAVVSRPESQGGGDVLLISSSNPNKIEWLLPKGGWDEGEGIQIAALREVIEEGGVNAKLLHDLGVVSDKGHVYYLYKMKASTVFDDWPESSRSRMWVSYQDAILMLHKRPHMIEMVKKAQEVDDLVKIGNLESADPKLAKYVLD